MTSTSNDPWIIPSPDQVDSFSDAMSLSPLEQAYQEVILALVATCESHTTHGMHIDMYSKYPCLGSWDSLDPLNDIFPTDRIIVEVMSLNKTP